MRPEATGGNLFHGIEVQEDSAEDFKELIHGLAKISGEYSGIPSPSGELWKELRLLGSDFFSWSRSLVDKLRFPIPKR